MTRSVTTFFALGLLLSLTVATAQADNNTLNCTSPGMPGSSVTWTPQTGTIEFQNIEFARGQRLNGTFSSSSNNFIQKQDNFPERILTGFIKADQNSTAEQVQIAIGSLASDVALKPGRIVLGQTERDIDSILCCLDTMPIAPTHDDWQCALTSDEALAQIKDIAASRISTPAKKLAQIQALLKKTSGGK